MCCVFMWMNLCGKGRGFVCVFAHVCAHVELTQRTCRPEDYRGRLVGGRAASAGRDDPDGLRVVHLRPGRHAAVLGHAAPEVHPQLDRQHRPQRDG